MYKVITNFCDRESGHVYARGDVFPFGDFEPTEQRIKELAGHVNALGKPVIELVSDKAEAAEKSKKRGRPPKTTE